VDPDLRFLLVASAVFGAALLVLTLQRYIGSDVAGILLLAIFGFWTVWGKHNGFPPSSSDMDAMIKEEEEDGDW
jgi:hypothetical protein